MTLTRFLVMYFRVFMPFFIWASTAVVCQSEEKVTVRPTVTVEFNSTDRMMTLNATGQFVCEVESDGMGCLSNMFAVYCVQSFKLAMASLNETDWCVWSKVNSWYSNLSTCTEDICDLYFIPWPNRVVEQTFLDIHSLFFKDCPTDELSDPPPAIMFALVITPICLIPVMVSLVVLKTKNGDGNS
ncbi:receptor activity-modifying protein 2 isoform X1 [Haplochromis burtoni]|nr:receptor activity-modifying protein 2 isoform X1 [Haplochromis burtoni]